MLLLGFACSLGFELRSSRAALYERELARLEHQARSAGQRFGARLQETSNALEAIRADSRALLGRPGGVASLNERMRMLVGSTAGVRTLLHVDAGGTVIASSRSEIIGTKVRDGERYRRISSRADPSLVFISPPFVTPLGVWALGVGKAVVDGQGRFDGYILAIIDPEYFKLLLDSARYAPDVTAAMIHGAGTIIVRVPDPKSSVGMDLAEFPESMFSRHLRAGKSFSSFTGVLRSTGREAVIVFQNIHPSTSASDGFVVASFSRQTDDLFAPWRIQLRERSILLSAIAIASALVVFVRQRRRASLALITGERDAARVREAEARRVSEERLAFAIRSTGAGVWDWDVHSNVMIWDDAMLRMYGVDRREFRGGVEAWKQALHPEDRDRAMAECQAALDGRREFDTEFRIRCPDGKVVHVKADGLVLRDDRGAPLRMIGLNRDVTQQRVVAERLRQKEQNYRSLFESSIDAVYLTRGDGSIVDANPAACRLHGMTLEEIRNAGRDDLVVRDHRLAGLLERRESSGHARGELTMLRKDGATFPAEVDSVLIRGPGQDTHAFVLARDVTEQRRAQLDLVRLATAIEQVPASILITDMDGRIEYVNPAFERVSGYARAEVLGRTPAVLKSGSHAQEFYASLWRTVSGGGVWQGRLVNRAKDGRLFTEDAVIAPVVDGDGRLRNYVAVKRDITDELRLAENLAHAKRLESVGQLAGGVAHDFNNLLTVILSCADELREGLAEGDAVLRSDADEILTAATRARDVTRQLLAFARRNPVAPVVLDLNAVLHGSERLLGRLIREDVRLTFVRAAGLWPVRADPGQLEQVLVNLVVNARDAMPDGGEVTIETHNFEAGEGEAAAFLEMTPGSYVRLRVRDTGVGMEQAVLDRIFEPFFTTKSVGKGTGLGLATVYGIVRQCGGFIRVESAPGAGTLFDICLPRSDDRPRTEAPRVGATASIGGTLLLVEDDPHVRDVETKALARAGHRVLVASGAHDALDIAARQPESIQLLVTDVVMPGLSGKQVAEALRARHPGVKVLFVSGYAEKWIATGGHLEEGVHFLAKPFTPGELAARVAEVLGAGPL